MTETQGTRNRCEDGCSYPSRDHIGPCSVWSAEAQERFTAAVQGTVTVTCRNSWYRVTFSKLPGREFGPYRFGDVIRELRVSALLSALDARNLVMDATSGSATKETG